MKPCARRAAILEVNALPEPAPLRHRWPLPVETVSVLSRLDSASGSLILSWTGHSKMNDVTRILNAMEQGDAKAGEELFPLVYEELRKLAAHKLAQEKPDLTLQATGLVHEAYLRLVDPPPVPVLMSLKRIAYESADCHSARIDIRALTWAGVLLS